MRASVVAIVIGLLLCWSATAQEPKQSPVAPAEAKSNTPKREELEKAFAERMSGAALVGHFTDRTRENAPDPVSSMMCIDV